MATRHPADTMRYRRYRAHATVGLNDTYEPGSVPLRTTPYPQSATSSLDCFALHRRTDCKYHNQRKAQSYLVY
ncbi:hypothetical protein FOMPIDRAFT_152971 [Fomitopsis schrenkii]|uniref:Uncharacterized protein n=1 Tax=Fomitopsis schrenkii TaxID=2126942 RepID=S8DGZ4_FOMSC|nr:hypothetical protein FOMPIDRAFT_152971 [Fomitopsis schrenkii]